MKKIIIMSSALMAGVVAALIVGNQILSSSQPSRTVAQWKDVYRTPTGLVAGADVIVVAEHMAAVPGRVVGRGEDATPFTNNTFSVKSVMKGEHNGEELVVEQTGGLTTNGAVYQINDGGSYQPGTTYLLFLKNRGDGTYYVINHQARYRIEGGMLEGVDPTDPVVARFHGKGLEEASKSIRARAELVK